MIYYTGGAASPYGIGYLMMILVSGLYVYCLRIEGILLTFGISSFYIFPSLLAPGEVNFYFFWTYASVLLTLSFITYLFLRTRYRYEKENFINHKKIEDKNLQLQELDKAKTRFFTNLTHEFRTPLVSLATVLQTLPQKISPDPQFEALLQTSYSSLSEMISNVNHLLTKAKSEQGFLEAHWAQADAVALIRRSVEVFQPLAHKKGLELDFINQLGKSHLGVYLDPPKFKEILSNLLSNALKFTESGRVEVHLEKEKDHLKISVSDTGMGIPKPEQQKIFEAFTQASNNTLRDVQGTGLGLSIVKDFVEIMGGKVQVESILGKGTTFECFLPLGESHVDSSSSSKNALWDTPTDPLWALKPIVNDKESVNFSDLKQEAYANHKLGQDKILIVEDNPQVVQALAYILKDGYNLYFAADGQEGLKRIQDVFPDLIISDIMMPKMDGYQLLQSVKRDAKLKKIPFIFLTAKTDLESKLLSLEEGADEYLTKPFNTFEVRSRIKNLIARKRMEAEMVHAEKMVALGQLVAGISHEILNPISYAKNAAANIPDFVSLYKKGQVPHDQVEERLQIAVENVEDGIQRVCDIAEALKGFIRQGKEGFAKEDIHQGLDSTLKILDVNFKNKFSIHKRYELEDKVYCNLNQLNQVFLNLLINATQAMAEYGGGHLWIETAKTKGMAMIRIQDDGPGIPEGLQDKIFDPFFTTKDVGEGTGLGLYISRQIVQEHGGKISLESFQGKGTQFTIYIPIDQEVGAHGKDPFTHKSIDQDLSQVQYPHRR